MIGVGLMLVFGTLVMFFIGHQMEGELRTDTLAAINEVRSRILLNLDNIKVWNFTKAGNPSFQCVIDKVPCGLAPRSFSIMEAVATPMSLSFSPGGFQCNPGQCAAEYLLTWEPVCAGAVPCVPTQIRISGILNFPNPAGMPHGINQLAHGILLLRSVD
jgi:hypothetical protein